MPAIDLAARFRDTPGAVATQAPASYAEAVTPSDDDDLTWVSRALWIGGAGDVAVIMQNGATVVFAAVPAGTMLPIRVSRVLFTGTDATDITSIT